MRGLLGFLLTVGCAAEAMQGGVLQGAKADQRLTCEHEKAMLRELLESQRVLRESLESQRVGFEQEKAQMAAGFAKLLKRSADDATPPRTADLARLIAPQGPQAAEGRLGSAASYGVSKAFNAFKNLF